MPYFSLSAPSIPGDPVGGNGFVISRAGAVATLWHGLPEVVARSPDVVARSPDVVARSPDVVARSPDVVARSPGGCGTVSRRLWHGLPEVVARSPDRATPSTAGLPPRWPPLGNLISVSDRLGPQSTTSRPGARDNTRRPSVRPVAWSGDHATTPTMPQHLSMPCDHVVARSPDRTTLSTAGLRAHHRCSASAPKRFLTPFLLPAQDPGPRRLASPSSYGSCIHTSLPVYPGAFPDTFSTFPRFDTF
jgi:hypothetical protein